MDEKFRDSSFELLRIIAQYMIVVYHILLFWFVLDNPGYEPMFKVAWIPLHIGVILYVLISGYFGIRFSIKGLFHILSQLFVYGLGLYLLSHFIYGDEIKVRRLFFISNTPYWFIRTYLFLYLLSPFINKAIKNISLNSRLILLLVLAWISCYVGFFQFDTSLKEGYNVLHFAFLYLIGDTLSKYKDRFNSTPAIVLVASYLFINVLSVLCGYYAITELSECTLVFDVFFQYNSLVLVLNALLLFLLFMRLKMKSRVINYLASSCLAVYLIHGSSLFLNHLIKDAAWYIQTLTNSVFVQLLYVCLLGLLVLACCIAMDKILTPVWKFANTISSKMEKTSIGRTFLEYSIVK